MRSVEREDSDHTYARTQKFPKSRHEDSFTESGFKFFLFFLHPSPNHRADRIRLVFYKVIENINVIVFITIIRLEWMTSER